ncbi:hypothetical protein [Dyadobacter sp. CY356]|uniref:hypothetical protein n=1 Tax=Dyadobacter sp. CY356 TaxID=2906442 RepID=UPI001F37C53A|nr:hypothetical protein [Dyadobacter sp. CY356]MCF0055498.1 hypothetical protein [Dyadobacter sp. CY356]
MIYYIFEPEWQSPKNPTTFETKEQWLKAIEDFDFLGQYCDDGWSEEVWNVTAGILPEGVKPYDEDYFLSLPEDEYLDYSEFYDKYATHEVKEYLIQEIVDGIGVEDGCSYPDYDRICGYSFEVKGK